MEQCEYCNKTFKNVATHINKCPTKLSMTPCPHCQKLFKRVASHIHKCPQRPEKNGDMADDGSVEEEQYNGEATNMTPCPHCQKMFKKVSCHIYRCKQKPAENGDVSDEENSEEEDVNGKVQEKTPCPQGKQKMSDKNISKDKLDVKPPGRKYYDQEEASFMTPCPHCNKLFKRVASHVYRCPKRPEGKDKVPNKDEIKNESSPDDESDDNGVASNMTPCPHCNKMFKRVAGHLYRCPQKPEENEEIADEETTEHDSLSDADDNDKEADMTSCPYCKMMVKFIDVHISNCPKRLDENAREKNVATVQYFHEISTSKNGVPKKITVQSEYRTSLPGTPYNPSPKPQSSVPEKSNTHSSIHLSINGNYMPSATPRGQPQSNPALSTPMSHSFTTRSYQSFGTGSNSSTPGDMKRPPIHGNHGNHSVHYEEQSPIHGNRSYHYEEQSLDVPRNDEDSITDYSEDNSFYRSSGSEESFSYLSQDLKRPPIHNLKYKSTLQREPIKKHQYTTDEEELFEFHHQVSRE